MTTGTVNSLPELEELSAKNDIIMSIYRHITDKNITLSSALYLMKDIMIIVEEFKGLTGMEKKQIVIDVMTLLVYNHGGEYKNQLSTLIRFIVPEAIDLIISATRGQLALNIIKVFEAEQRCCFVV